MAKRVSDQEAVERVWAALNDGKHSASAVGRHAHIGAARASEILALMARAGEVIARGDTPSRNWVYSPLSRSRTSQKSM